MNLNAIELENRFHAQLEGGHWGTEEPKDISWFKDSYGGKIELPPLGKKLLHQKSYLKVMYFIQDIA